MKKQIHSLWFLTTLVLLLGVGVSLNAQQPAQPPQTQPTQAQQPAQDPQQPAQQPQAQPGQAPDTAGQPPDTKADTKAQSQQGAGQTFTGTVTKSGDKYVLQDASGTTYDIDNQDAAKKFEGKKVNIHGTLDPNGKTIHVQ